MDSRIGDASDTEPEIEHSLQLLLDPKLAGQAFFYIRDSAHSDPKADAGEGPQDLEAIADQIKPDLWALIESRFPERVQSDALARDERAAKSRSYPWQVNPSATSDWCQPVFQVLPSEDEQAISDLCEMVD